MKIISLNTWGGRAGKENILDFFKNHADVDIFCLQEMWNGGEHMNGRIAGGMVLENIVHKLLFEIGNILTDHDCYFSPHYHEWYGLAILVRKGLKVRENGELFVYKNKGYIHADEEGNHARNIQWISVKTSAGIRTIINFHGLWNGQGKNDSEDRLLQSDNIIDFLKTLNNPYVICGDFNLKPNTKSMKKFEEFGLRNLINEYGISSTRTSFYKKQEKFADYTLVSKEININDFKILPEVVSDHSAMYIDFE